MYRSESDEPSGLRLMRLINTHILEIAQIELSNRNRLRLYGTGGWWTAFDRSAYALSKIIPSAESLVITPPGAPFSIVGLTISDRELKKYMNMQDVLSKSMDYLEYQMDTIDLVDFETWQTRLVKEYKKLLSC